MEAEDGGGRAQEQRDRALIRGLADSDKAKLPHNSLNASIRHRRPCSQGFRRFPKQRTDRRTPEEATGTVNTAKFLYEREIALPIGGIKFKPETP